MPKKNYFFFTNLQHFELSQFSSNAHIEQWLTVLSVVESSPPIAFSVAF